LDDFEFGAGEELTDIGSLRVRLRECVSRTGGIGEEGLDAIVGESVLRSEPSRNREPSTGVYLIDEKLVSLFCICHNETVEWKSKKSSEP